MGTAGGFASWGRGVGAASDRELLRRPAEVVQRS
jgi:hypothetical protein